MNVTFILNILYLKDQLQSKQCDQMARLFILYLAIYKNENLPNSI